jgi:hypothetical protein
MSESNYQQEEAMPDVKAKKFLAIPRDAFELLTRRHVELADATEDATNACAESGQAVYVVELRAIASRADRPVKVTKL